MVKSPCCLNCNKIHKICNTVTFCKRLGLILFVCLLAHIARRHKKPEHWRRSFVFYIHSIPPQHSVNRKLETKSWTKNNKKNKQTKLCACHSICRWNQSHNPPRAVKKKVKKVWEDQPIKTQILRQDIVTMSKVSQNWVSSKHCVLHLLVYIY